MEQINIKKSQIIRLFSRSPWDGIYWFSGYEGEGKAREWHKNGVLKKEFFTKKFKRYGKYISYHSNGKVYEECYFNNGMDDGEYKMYNEDGLLIKHYMFDNDKELADFIKHPELKKKYNIK